MLLNDPLVQELSKRWAIHLQSSGYTPEAAASAIVESAYGRFAEENELLMLAQVIQANPDDWTPVTQAVLASKEFQYLE